MNRAVFIILLLIVVMLFSAVPLALGQAESTALECPGSPPTQLAPGMTAFVIIPPEGEARRDLRVRAEPGGEQVGSLSSGQYFVITGDPICDDEGLLWWPIETRDGSLSGWSVEGFAPDDYMIIPDSAGESAAQPTAAADVQADTEDDPCSAAPLTRLAMGMTAYAAMPDEGEPGQSLRVRSQPGGEQEASLPPGTLFEIQGTGGCDEDGLRWYYIVTFDGEMRGYSAEAISPDNYLITPFDFADRESITVNNAHQLEIIRKIIINPRSATDPSVIDNIAISSDGSTLATVSNARVTLWDMRTGEAGEALDMSSAYPTWSPQGNLLATSGYPNINLLDMPSGSKQDSFPGAWPYTWNADGSLFAYRSGSNIMLRDMDSQETVGQISDIEVESVAFSPDNRLLAVADQEQVHLWNMDDLLESVGDDTLDTAAAHWEMDNRIGQITFSPDNTFLAVEQVIEDETGSVTRVNTQLWDVETRTQHGEFRDQFGAQFAVDSGILGMVEFLSGDAFSLWNVELMGELGGFGDVYYSPIGEPYAPYPVKMLISPDETLIVVLLRGVVGYRELEFWAIPSI